MASFGPLFYKTYLPSSFHTEPALRAGFGALVEGDVDYNGGIELGIFYMHKDYYRKEAEQIFAEKTKRIHIIMGYRHWFSNYLSAGLSFFSAYTMGDPTAVNSDFAPSEGEPNTSAQDTTEYGFDLSIIYEFLTQEKWALILDGRYSHSVTSKRNEEAHHYGVMLGYKMPIEVN